MQKVCQIHEKTIQNGSQNHRKVNEKSLMKSIREFIGRKFGKMASKVTPRGPKSAVTWRVRGPGVPEEVRSSSRRLQAQGSLLDRHHTNKHPANKRKSKALEPRRSI